MAQRTVISHYSDLSGQEISDRDANFTFSLDGADYEIDLSFEEQLALREALAPFVSAARPVERSRGSRGRLAPPAAPDKEPSAKALREWASENGFDVPTRGRVPEVVREAYQASQAR